jgi:hypothetical protein
MKTAREPKEIIVGGKMPLSIVKRVDAEAARKGVSRSAILRWALLKYFESEKVAV